MQNTRSISITVKETDKYITVCLDGLLNIFNVRTFKDILMAKSFREKDLIIDFSNLEHIDSSGIGVLFTIIKLQREHNKEVWFENANEDIVEIFRISNLSTFLENKSV